MPRDVPSERHSWLLQRRSALDMRQLKLLFFALSAPALALASVFLWWGYWYMLAYAVLEMAAIATCLRHYARHVADYDRIDITPAAIIIEQCRARRQRHILLNPWTTRLRRAKLRKDQVALSDQETEITVAEFLPLQQRRQLARDLACHLPAC